MWTVALTRLLHPMNGTPGGMRGVLCSRTAWPTVAPMTHAQPRNSDFAEPRTGESEQGLRFSESRAFRYPLTPSSFSLLSVKQALHTGHDSGRADRNAGGALAGTRRRARRRRHNAASRYVRAMDACACAAYYPQSRELGQPIPFARSGKGDKPL